MKDFDSERELRPRLSVEHRQFVLGGETFVARDRLRPDALTYLDDIKEERRDFQECETCGHKPHRHILPGVVPTKPGPNGPCQDAGCQCQQFVAKLIEKGSGLAEQLAALDSTVLELIEGGEEGGEARARWLALRARQDDPLTMVDIMGVIQWITSGDTARPTGEPGVSTAGQDTTGTLSMDASSSLAATG